MATASLLIFEDLTYKLNGILFSVHNYLGRYLNEKQYCDLIENKLKEQNIKYLREYEIPVSFAGEHKRRNIADFLIENKIILEVKTKRIIQREDYY